MQNLELTEMFSCPSRVCPFGKTKNKSVILLQNEIFKDSVSFHFGGKAFNFSHNLRMIKALKLLHAD